jgi:hypothetical protein
MAADGSQLTGMTHRLAMLPQERAEILAGKLGLREVFTCGWVSTTYQRSPPYRLKTFPHGSYGCVSLPPHFEQWIRGRDQVEAADLDNLSRTFPTLEPITG